MSELKAGDSLDFKIGDKTLTVGPVPYGQIKKILRIAFTIGGDIKGAQAGSKDVLSVLPVMMEKYISELIPLLFRPGGYSFLTPAWIDENMSVPQMRMIVETAMKVNGLEDFFAPPKATVTGNGREPTPTILTESPGSTTTLDSPTAGAPKT